MMVGPSDLAWWGWMLCAAAAGVAGLVARLLDDLFEGAVAASGTFLALIFWLVSAILFLVGLIRFIKWVWTG